MQIVRTAPVDAGLLAELGEADTQETFKDERLCTLLLFAAEVFIPASFIFPKTIIRVVYFYRRCLNVYWLLSFDPTLQA